MNMKPKMSGIQRKILCCWGSPTCGASRCWSHMLAVIRIGVT